MSHGTLSRDSTREAERLQIERWRTMSPEEKLQAVGALSQCVRQLALSGIRQRYPAASESECKLRLARLTLGAEMAVRVYPEAAALDGD